MPASGHCAGGEPNSAYRRWFWLVAPIFPGQLGLRPRQEGPRESPGCPQAGLGRKGPGAEKRLVIHGADDGWKEAMGSLEPPFRVKRTLPLLIDQFARAGAALF